MDKMMRYTEKHENNMHSNEKKQATESACGRAQILNLAKTSAGNRNMFKELKKNML